MEEGMETKTPHVVAGIYEIGEEIGAGGGGIVYLGRHVRLDKQIVLKADRRRLGTDPEKLRREVDMLKNLSHTYIPQVYDFVPEDGIVYTVMDYIDGGSLDKLLRDGRGISQPEVVRWAIQLLRALVYLHGRPPHGILHGDIKPANIMLRPSGDICLIDYNIALALGEDGAVKVGFSRGYASPEHYGADYLRSGKAAAVGELARSEVSRSNRRTETDDERTETDDERTERTDEQTERVDGRTERIDERTEAIDEQTEVSEEKAATSSNNRASKGNSDLGSSTGSGRGLLLDVRSDIYSLGATLYHLISGRRPAEDAREVEALAADVCSPAVSAILRRAMEPEPSMRYQTAQEMLDAFLNLHINDARTIRRRRRMKASAAVLSALFLAGGFCCFAGLKQLEQRQAALALSEYSADALREGDVAGAVSLAMQAIPREKGIFQAPVTPQAQKALTDALGVYDLSDGFKSLGTVELPSAPFGISVSPDGSCFAAVYAYEAAVFRMEGSEKVASLPIRESALSDLIFTDESHVVYAGQKGVTAYDLETQAALWTGETATTLAVSGDRKIVAAVDRDEGYAVIYQASDGRKIGECSFEGRHMTVAVNDLFANPQNRVFAMNEDGSLLAVSFSDGGLEIFDLDRPEDGIILYEESDYQQFSGGFCGKYFAFTAAKGGEAVFGLADTEEAALVGNFKSGDPLLLQADESGICLANGNLLVRLDPETMEETELAYTNGANIAAFSAGEEFVLAVTDDQSFSFYDGGANLLSKESVEQGCEFALLKGGYALLGNRTEQKLRMLKKEDNGEEQIFAYDARYGHDEARVSADGLNAMLFDHKGFRIFGQDGERKAKAEIPDAESVYDQQFKREDGDSFLEVIWYDGTVRRYSAQDGALIKEDEREKPKKDLLEEFTAVGYRIVAPLHGPPEVYDADSGKLKMTLEEEGYLTYVTEAGEYIITEYIDTEGDRYGILRNRNFEKLAYLPGLCDIVGDTLVFDDRSGSLRRCGIYSLDELTALGEEYLIESGKGGSEK